MLRFCRTITTYNMLVDTHCHLNFKVFKSRVEPVLERARQASVERVVIVGADLKSSKHGLKLAEKHEGVWASVGIHPHHVLAYLEKALMQIKMTGESLSEVLELVLDQIEEELAVIMGNEKVVAVGEVGLDLYEYQVTKYQDSQSSIDQELFLAWQKAFLRRQLQVAAAHSKSVILHNRQTVDQLLEFFADHPELVLPQKMVLHCCEPDVRLLEFAQNNQLFIGVDGDVTYDIAKQEFIRQVPLSMLVLETDSPYMTPEPDRTLYKEKKEQLKYYERVCEPRHAAVVAEFVAQLKNVDLAEVACATTANANILFSLPAYQSLV